MDTLPNDMGLRWSPQSAMSLKRTGKRKLVRFDGYFHNDSFPIPSFKNEFRIYIPAQGGNQPADVLELTSAVFLKSPPATLYPVHFLYGGTLQIDAPQNFKDTVHFYVLPFEDMTLGFTTYDKAGKELEQNEIRNQKAYKLFRLGFRAPTHSIRLSEVGGLGFGNWGLVRVECYV